MFSFKKTEYDKFLTAIAKRTACWETSKNAKLGTEWKLFLNKDGYNCNNLFPKILNEGAFPEAVKQTTFMYITFDASIWCIGVDVM